MRLTGDSGQRLGHAPDISNLLERKGIVGPAATTLAADSCWARAPGRKASHNVPAARYGNKSAMLWQLISNDRLMKYPYPSRVGPEALFRIKVPAVVMIRHGQSLNDNSERFFAHVPSDAAVHPQRSSQPIGNLCRPSAVAV
ncbi:hypothetical protein [Nocardia sp. NPDC006630]|uniref:hypothetical protein n=1 Tax=Nocardia sp. NPDC006630 TaxID=3157181 RepID=UPI0033A756F0